MGNYTGIDTTSGCWLCTGVAIEIVIFLGTALFFTHIAFRYAQERAWPYYMAGAAWLLFVAYELAVSAINSIHWYFGLLGTAMVIAMFFLGATGNPRPKEPPPQPPNSDYWNQRRERDKASKARRGKL